MLRLALLLTLFSSGAAFAQDVPQVVVAGVGKVRIPPDLAVLTFTIRGEGRTSDEAAQRLQQTRSRVEQGLSAMSPAIISTSGLSIDEVRGPDCDVDPYDDRPRLSEGDCAVAGYIATLGLTVRATDVESAGTMLSLAARLGAKDGSVRFGLQHPDVAARDAAAAALTDARARAETIIAASTTMLGDVLYVRDADARMADLEEIVVTGGLQPGPLAAPPPVRITLKPEPIETSARLTVAFRLEPRPQGQAVPR